MFIQKSIDTVLLLSACWSVSVFVCELVQKYDGGSGCRSTRAVITFYTHNLSRRFTATLKSKAAVLMNSEIYEDDDVQVCLLTCCNISPPLQFCPAKLIQGNSET